VPKQTEGCDCRVDVQSGGETGGHQQRYDLLRIESHLSVSDAKVTHLSSGNMLNRKTAHFDAENEQSELFYIISET
jgi:hypothetical protein